MSKCVKLAKEEFANGERSGEPPAFPTIGYLSRG